MKKSTSVAALVFCQLASLAVPPSHAADAVPDLNISSSCQAEAAAAPEGKKQCLKDEQDARETLTRQWETFALADKRRCTELATLAGVASYVELLTCLQMAIDASKLPSKDK